MGQAGLLPPDGSSTRLSLGCCWDFSALAFLPPPLITQFLGDFAIYSDCRIFIVDCQVLGLGVRVGAGKVERIWKHGLPDFQRSDSASSPPASGTFLVLQHILAGSALNSVLELSVMEASRPCLGWGPTASHQPGPPSQNLSAGCSVPALTSQSEAWTAAWDPADTAQDT